MVPALKCLPLAGLLLFAWIEFILWFLNLRGTGDQLGFLVFVILCELLGALSVAIFIGRKSRRPELSIERAAEKWLIRRRTGSASPHSWHKGALLFVPTFLALIFFFFEPETVAIWQHIVDRAPVSVGAYRISIPITWIRYEVPDQEHPDEEWITDVEGIARMGRHRSWAMGGADVWDIGFSATTNLDPTPLKARRFPEFSLDHKVSVAGRELDCQELQYLGRHFHVVTIACSTSERDLYTNFEANAEKTAVFYEFLKNNVSRDPH